MRAEPDESSAGLHLRTRPSAVRSRIAGGVACRARPSRRLRWILSIESPSADTVRDADLIAFYLPMHTATRLAAIAMEKFRQLNPGAHLCCYGLYAALNESYLRKLGVQYHSRGRVRGRSGLARRATRRWRTWSAIGTFNFAGAAAVPAAYAIVAAVTRSLRRAASQRARKRSGYTEASRGCKHLCRHCPVVPVYRGSFRVVQAEVVLEDIRRQVGAGAEHITFGDPDFFNGPTHAIRIVEALHREFPELTYDATIKIEHLLKHRDLLPRLKRNRLPLRDQRRGVGGRRSFGEAG